jgi:hypothetical protein
MSNEKWLGVVCPFCKAKIEKPEPSYWETTPGMTDGASQPVEPGQKMQGGYKVGKCPNCEASYSCDPFCDNEQMADEIAFLLGVEIEDIFGKTDSELGINTFIYHNYSPKRHQYRSDLNADDDRCTANGLDHLWFVKKI